MADRKLWFSASGDDVADLQWALADAGLYSVEHGDQLGRFGPRTEQAVRAFQSMHGLPENGVVDDAFREYLGT